MIYRSGTGVYVYIRKIYLWISIVFTMFFRIEKTVKLIELSKRFVDFRIKVEHPAIGKSEYSSGFLFISPRYIFLNI